MLWFQFLQDCLLGGWGTTDFRALWMILDDFECLKKKRGKISTPETVSPTSAGPSSCEVEVISSWPAADEASCQGL